MTQSIWSANNGTGGQGLFDLFANLDASRAGSPDALAMTELGPQPADMSVADQNFFGALNEALAGLSAAPNEALPQPLSEFNFVSDKPEKLTADESNQLALALLAGAAGGAYLPATKLPQNFRPLEKQNANSEVLYASPATTQKLGAPLQPMQSENPLLGTNAAAPLTLAVLQTQKTPLKLLDANKQNPLSAADLQNLLQTEASRTQPLQNSQPLQMIPNEIPNELAKPSFNMQQLRSELSRIAPEAKVEMLSVSGENKAASQANITSFVPVSQSLGELRDSLKDHQVVFNKRLADLESKMSSRLDESMTQQLAADAAAKDNFQPSFSKITSLGDPSFVSSEAPSKMVTLGPDGSTNQAAALTQTAQTAQNAQATNGEANQNPATAINTNPSMASAAAATMLSKANSRAQNVKANDNEKNGEQNKFENLLENSSYAASLENPELDAKEKKEGGQDKNDGKRDGLTTLLDHKGSGKIWTTEARDKLSDLPNVSPMTRGALERTRNMAIQLQGRGGTAKIQISDNRLGNVNLEIRVEQGNKVFVEIRSGNQKLKEELRENVEALKRSLEDSRMALAELKFTVDTSGVAQGNASANSQQNSQQNNSSRQDAQNLQQQLQERAAQQEGFSRQFFGGQNSGQFQSGENFAGDVVNNAARNKSFNQSSAANLNGRETNIQRSANGSLKVRA